MNEQPNGRTRMTTTEKETILAMRSENYSIKQIAEHTGRSATSVKRVMYATDQETQENSKYKFDIQNSKYKITKNENEYAVIEHSGNGNFNVQIEGAPCGWLTGIDVEWDEIIDNLTQLDYNVSFLDMYCSEESIVKSWHLENQEKKQ